MFAPTSKASPQGCYLFALGKDPKETYRYANATICAMAQYMKSLPEAERVPFAHWLHGEWGEVNLCAAAHGTEDAYAVPWGAFAERLGKHLEKINAT